MTTQAGLVIRERASQLAEAIVARQYELQPEVWRPYGDPGRSKSIRDAGYHLIYLAEALDADDSNMFTSYLAWAKVLFAGLKFPESVLPATIECTRQVLVEQLPQEVHAPALQVLETGLQSLAKAPSSLPSYLAGNTPLDQLARAYLDSLLVGDRQEASRMILEAVERGSAVKDVYLQVFQRTQREIGRLWQTNQISVAQEHFCTAATQLVMSQLYPYIFTGERRARRLVATCVGGELHEIGARMVADFFEMEGWDTYFLGANTPTESILHMVKEHRANILAVSATMTFHVERVRELIAAARQKELKARILVGGYPFNIAPGLWRNVGADGYAPDAQEAI
ncbi:MAG: cobalamin-dependent protein, partial [Anaerolineae bacterium]|nr:cobalamin-dependent protein [Anaerolineae bacterium]